MQLRHVEYFVATVDEGSVSGAARVLHVTQPALSRQLRQLENELGVTLFDRESGRLSLNRTGRELLPAARHLLAASAALGDTARYLRSGRVDRLTIAAPTVTLTDVLSPFVATMGSADPVVDVRSADGESPAQMLAAGADLAIGTARPPKPYASRVLAVLPIWAYAPADHAWADRGSVSLIELLDEPLVVLPPDFTSREALDTAIRTEGGSVGAMVEAGNGTIAQALAAAGRGVAVVSDDPRFDLHGLAVDLPNGQPLSVKLTASWDSRSVAARTMVDLVGRLSGYIADRYGPYVRGQGSP